MHHEYRRLCHYIGQPFWQEPGRTKKMPPVYLSKTKLQTGVTRIEEEDIIERVMIKHGIEIVHPERLSFPNQVKLFSQTRSIIGSAGSAFHTSIFAPAKSTAICIVPQGIINSNMVLIDRINGNKSFYYLPKGGHLNSGARSGFGGNFIIKEVEKVAKDVAEIACSIS